MNFEETMAALRERSDPVRLAGMSRYGIVTGQAIGVSMPLIRETARLAGKSHELAEQLWQSGIHEARIAASIVDRPEWVDEPQMERWVADFNSWDVCDQVCMGLFCRTPFADAKVLEWSRRPEEFVKRAAFAMIAGIAVHDKKASDARLLAFLPVIIEQAGDERNFVKKAVNWSLRQVGKRNAALCAAAIRAAEEIGEQGSRSARWIASDALRELRSRSQS
jgi:3-methyladenine DNA glycosylase AlkD